MPIHAQLQAIADELRAAEERLHRLASVVPASEWQRRQEPDRWSIAECVAHLNLTTEAYRPLIEGALAEGNRRGRVSSARYRRDLLGWMLWRTMGPPVRFHTKTLAAFVPRATAPSTELVAQFDRLQAEQLEWVSAADELPLHQIRVVSPFNARLSYNLYSALSILARHQHRHLWQAENAWAALQAAPPG